MLINRKGFYSEPDENFGNGTHIRRSICPSNRIDECITFFEGFEGDNYNNIKFEKGYGLCGISICVDVGYLHQDFEGISELNFTICPLKGGKASERIDIPGYFNPTGLRDDRLESLICPPGSFVRGFQVNSTSRRFIEHISKDPGDSERFDDFGIGKIKIFCLPLLEPINKGVWLEQKKEVKYGTN